MEFDPNQSIEQYSGGYNVAEKIELLIELAVELKLTVAVEGNKATHKWSPETFLKLSMDGVEVGVELVSSTFADAPACFNSAFVELSLIMSEWEFMGWLISQNGYLDGQRPLDVRSARELEGAVWHELHWA